MPETTNQINQTAVELLEQFVADHQIVERIGLDIEDVRMHLDLMAKRGLVTQSKTFGGASAQLTPQGRLMVQQLEDNW